MSATTLQQLAALTQGDLVGPADLAIAGVANIESVQAGQMTFVLEDKNFSAAEKSPAAALVVSLKVTSSVKPLLRVANPRLAMAKILALFETKPKFSGISAQSIIAKTARLGKNVTVYPGVYIGEEVTIGDDSILYPNVVVYDRCKIGQRVILHSGSVIGVDGFGFVLHQGIYEKIPQIGNVVIEDDVEIYSNNSVARATLGSTVIGKGSKIDNLCHIAHNCKLGDSCALAAQVGFAGGVTLQDHVTAGGQVAFNGHITVGSNTVVLGRSGVTKDWPPNSAIFGFMAQDQKEEKKAMICARRLPELFQRIEELEKKIAELTREKK